ncbi:MAG: xanthine dehydrogenase family protein molybdopterin-binding subunit [Abitibacteriaceae bacterium]|nr:xanthine dehydrogenase family protein molybdopterin-binding subunit [Abditibacteriaceae bacterium]
MPKKMKITVVENGFDKEVEIEVPDEAGSWPKPDTMRVVNKREPRMDGFAKVTGHAKYALDVRPPGMLWAKMLRAPYGKARLKSIDTDAASKIEGFKAITGDPKAGREFSFAGEPVCAVAATSEEAADDALHALNAQWEALPAVTTLEKALSDVKNGDAGKNILGDPQKRETGNADAALQGAGTKVEGRYQTSTVHHVCLEPHGQTIAPGTGADSKKLTVWATTQGIQGIHEQFVSTSKLKASDVEVICEYMGGGFGSKFSIGPEGRFAWELSQQTGAPIKLLCDRKGEFQSQGNRPGYIADIRAAATPDGKITAIDVDNYGANSGGCAMPYVYKFDTSRTQQREVRLNAGAPTAFRAPGHPEASFMTEAVVDDLAYKVGLDPLEFRRKHFANDKKRMRQMAAGAQAIGWEQKFQKQPGSMPGAKKRGVGMAVHAWGGGGGPSTPITCKIHPDGSVEALSGTQDLGTGTRTVIAMIVAEELGLKPTDITVEIGHRSYGNAGGSGGSTTCASVSPAAFMAGLQARLALFNAVAPALSAKPDELELRDGTIAVKGNPARNLTWKQATAKLGMNPISSVGQWVPGLSSSGVAGCGFAEVEVDVETGKVHVVRYVAVQDSGLVINPTTWESQILGGVIQGLGYATLEERHLDPRDAGFLNANLLDYKVPMSKEIPEIIVINDPEPERGVIGVGEPPIISPGGAIANAVYNATGVRMRHLPITPDKFLMAMREQKGVA